MQALNLVPFPTLTTDRLRLRQLGATDDYALFALRSDEKVNEFLARNKATSIKDAQDFRLKINKSIADNASIYWGIALKNTDELIGTICFWNIEVAASIAEIGYELLSIHQGRGIMQEALEKVIDFGFNTIGFNTITAYVNSANPPSIKLLERHSFKKQGTLAAHNELIYALTKEK